MNALSILEIYEQKKKDKQDKSKYYNVIVEKCYRKIREAVKYNKWELTWKVPENVIGLPIYNYNHCIAFVMTNLKHNGYVVVYHHPGLLLISWKPEDVKQFNTLKNLVQKSIYTINNGSEKLNECYNYDAQFDLQKFNTANLDEYIKSKRQRTQLALPAIPSYMSKDIPNNTISNSIVNDNRIINLDIQPVINNPTEHFASLNESYNPPTNLNQTFNNVSQHIHKEYQPIQTFLPLTHEQPIKYEQQLQQQQSQRDNMPMKNIVINDIQQEHLEKKILKDDYNHHQNIKQAQHILDNSKIYDREKEYEKQQVAQRKQNLSNINTLLMSKDYLKKFKDINDKGKKMMNL